METLGEFVKTRLKELGINRAQLAQKIEMDPSIISRIMTGKTGSPDRETLEKLSGPLGCSVGDLENLCRAARSEVDSEAKVLIPESIWALCLVLQSVAGKPIKEILEDKLREVLKEGE